MEWLAQYLGSWQLGVRGFGSLGQCALHGVWHKAGALLVAVFRPTGWEFVWRSGAPLDIGSVVGMACFTGDLGGPGLSRKLLWLLWS